MGYRFRIEYKTGTSNRVADGLSRLTHQDPTAQLFHMFAQPLPDLLPALRRENETAPDLLELHHQASDLPPGYAIHDGLLYYGSRMVISSDSSLRLLILREFHSSPSAGHPGIDRTFRCIAGPFFWKGMRRDVQRFVATCVTCQETKYSTQRPSGLLQPLPVPARVWDELTMDFIIGLPPS